MDRHTPTHIDWNWATQEIAKLPFPSMTDDYRHMQTQYQDMVEKQCTLLQQDQRIDWNEYFDKSIPFLWHLCNDQTISWLKSKIDMASDANESTPNTSAFLRCLFAVCVSYYYQLEKQKKRHDYLLTIPRSDLLIRAIFGFSLGDPLHVSDDKSKPPLATCVTALVQYTLAELALDLDQRRDMMRKSAKNGCPKAMLALVERENNNGCFSHNDIETKSPRSLEIAKAAEEYLWPALQMRFHQAEHWLYHGSHRTKCWYASLLTWIHQLQAKIDEMQEIQKHMDEGQIITRIVSQY